MNLKNKNQKGFTLIELLVVISIISLLSSVVLSSLNTAREKSRDTKRKRDLTELRTALELYRNDNGSYPVVTANTDTAWRGISSPYGSHTTTGATGYIPNLAPSYIKELPLDPKGGLNGGYSREYLYRSNGSGYKVISHFGPEYPLTGGTFIDPTRSTYAWMVCVDAPPGVCAW